MKRDSPTRSEADERVLTLTRTIAASPEKLFDAWTKPDIVLKWWGPEDASVGEHELDIRVGGRWSTELVGSMGGNHTCSGVYKVIERPHRLAFTWAWRQPDGARGHETLVEVTFEKVERGTLLTVRQKIFQDVQQRDMHGLGWNSTLNKLERLFA